MLGFTFSFLPKHGDAASLVASAEEVGNTWEEQPDNDQIAHLIANTIATDVCLPGLGYDKTDEKIYKSVLYSTLRTRTDW